jgi:hypothetical protein
MTTGEPGYIDVLVTVRTADDGERRFWVELDPTADLQKWLLPDLVQALHLGNPGNFKLTLEGSLNSLVVILTSKEPSAPPARRAPVPASPPARQGRRPA